MEIISKLVKIESDFSTDVDFIETKLRGMGLKPLRWAVVNIEKISDKKNMLTISVASENL